MLTHPSPPAARIDKGCQRCHESAALTPRQGFAVYERLGFQRIERRYFGSDDCWVYRLDRARYAQQHDAGEPA